MVDVIKKKDKIYFACGICGLVYGNEQLGQECERWCSTHHSCSLEIIKDALFKSKEEID